MVLQVQALLLDFIVGQNVFAFAVGVVPTAVLILVVVNRRRKGGSAGATGNGAVSGVGIIAIVVIVGREILWLDVRIQGQLFRKCSDGASCLPSTSKAC
jgi:hypothetical protein